MAKIPENLFKGRKELGPHFTIEPIPERNFSGRQSVRELMGAPKTGNVAVKISAREGRKIRTGMFRRGKKYFEIPVPHPEASKYPFGWHHSFHIGPNSVEFPTQLVPALAHIAPVIKDGALKEVLNRAIALKKPGSNQDRISVPITLAQRRNLVAFLRRRTTAFEDIPSPAFRLSLRNRLANSKVGKWLELKPT
ncbi:MAG: hypothetical protein ABH863_03435 [Candidatus Micrarchaeota archaeon]